MNIQQLFSKDIFRTIQGVVKVEQTDEREVKKELEEYVVTKELILHLRDFFTKYNASIDQPTENIGIWISGFFGSGKSHFLKMLSYILDNKEVAGKTPLDYFLEKIDDELLIAEIRKAVTTFQKDVILFNIDSKSNATSDSKSTILDVFRKVFYEKLGYTTVLPQIAEVEWQLDQDGLYEKFKEEYLKQSGRNWVSDRKKAAIRSYQSTIIEAIAQTTDRSKDDVEKWINTPAPMTPEEFALRIKEYCQRNDGKRIFFFIDEIGQYLGHDSKLMLNLQTIVENLGKELQGKAWVIVTSQAELEHTVHNMDSADFSRLSGRFPIKLALSSKNTDEVIQKRILEKTQSAIEYLDDYYREKQVSIANVIDFTNCTGVVRSYDNRAEFTQNYPFIPYQFTLLQNVFEQIRRVGVTGAHLSKGERSLLSAFQESSQKIADKEVGALVPFYSFYDTISNVLTPSVKKTIEQVNEDYRDITEFDQNVLKTLFLIKYLKDIKATIGNIATLCVTHVDQKKLELKQQIQESLNRLEHEKIIAKNADEYEFLTDDERDIERQIKDTVVHVADISKELSKIFFDSIYKATAVKHDDYQSFSYNQRINEFQKNTNKKELTLQIVTSDYQNANESLFSEYDKDTVLVQLLDDEELLNTLRYQLQIAKFLRQGGLNQEKDAVQKVAKKEQQLKHRIIELAEQSLLSSKYRVSGNLVEPTGNKAPLLFEKVLKKLTEASYPKYELIYKHYQESDIQQILSSRKVEQQSFEKETVNTQAHQEIIQFLKLKNNQKVRVTLKDIEERFTQIPYGWRRQDVIACITLLFVDKKINLEFNQENMTLQHSEIKEALFKKSFAERVVITLFIATNEDLLHDARSIIIDTFDKPSLSQEEVELFDEIELLLQKELTSVNTTLGNYVNTSGYPGKKELTSYKEILEELSRNRKREQMFSVIVQQKIELKESKQAAQPVFDFFENQKTVFVDGRQKLDLFLQDSTYFSDINRKHIDELSKIIENEHPYFLIRKIRQLLETIGLQHSSLLLDEKKKTKNELEQQINKLKMLAKDKEIEKSRLSEFVKIENLRPSIEKESSITVLAGQRSRILEIARSIRLSILELSAEAKQIEDGTTQAEIAIVSLSKYSNKKQVLQNQEDLGEFIKELEEKLGQLIKEGKTIHFTD